MMGSRWTELQKNLAATQGTNFIWPEAKLKRELRDVALVRGREVE
jgi:hypothetical protein